MITEELLVRADNIFDAYMEKREKVNPDGSTCEDLERDLFEPLFRLVAADCVEMATCMSDPYSAMLAERIRTKYAIDA